MQKTVFMVGGSLCLRIPKTIADLMAIKDGSKVEMSFDGKRLCVVKA